MSRNWLVTRNNFDADAKAWLQGLFTTTKAVYVCGQLEVNTSGVNHIQAFANYSNTKKLGGITVYDKFMHCDIVRVNNGAHDYCMKDDTRVEGPWEFGVKPIQRNNKKDWESIWEKAKIGDIESIPKDILVKHYLSIKHIGKDNLKIKEATGLRGMWIWGPSGIGKSRHARALAGDKFYPKMCNKWWDGYQDEKVVIMDDVGLEHKGLGHHLKIWADRYGFIMETKGGASTDSYDSFIVTSQYAIEEIFDDEKTVEALKRRFKVIHMMNLD